MTYVSWKMSRFPKSRVIGIGCNLDSARFQHIITNLLKAQIRGKDVWLIGEQGENKGKIIILNNLEFHFYTWSAFCIDRITLLQEVVELFLI